MVQRWRHRERQLAAQALATSGGTPTTCLGAHGVRLAGSKSAIAMPTTPNTDSPPSSHFSAVDEVTPLNWSRAGSGLAVPSSQIL